MPLKLVAVVVVAVIFRPKIEKYYSILRVIGLQMVYNILKFNHLQHKI